jgi:peptidoglycan/xylan/chitin deacetylase (PgdA/CDA1 family)
LTRPPEAFAADLERSKNALEDAIGTTATGYRAPCFSLDRQRLDRVQSMGFGYDSSRIDFSSHPLYGHLDMDGYRPLSPSVFRRHDFFEFQVSTLRFWGKNIPVSGGGYLRILPWALMRRLVARYLRGQELYVLYIHPFELSPQASPPLPRDVPLPARVRFRLGRRTTPDKLRKLIALLRQNGYRFMTFSQLRTELLAQTNDAAIPS